MAIDDIIDWNSRIAMCACCEMPDHPPPRIEYEHKDVLRPAPGWTFHSLRSAVGQMLAPGFTAPIPESLIVYRTVTRTTTDSRPDGETVTWSVNNELTAELNLFGYPTPIVETNPEQRFAGSQIPVNSHANGVYSGSMEYDDTDENGNPQTYTYSVTLAFSNPVTFEELKGVAVNLLAAMNWTPSSGNSYWKTYSYFKPLSSGYYTGENVYQETGYPGSVNLITVRYRVGAPEDYLGSAYFRIEWDEVVFPEEENSQPAIIASRSWEWTGADEFSDWFVIDPPQQPGSVGVRNLRAVSYRSPFGTKPRFLGDRWPG